LKNQWVQIIINDMKDKRPNKDKKYRHGIDVTKKQKIKKSDLLRRIELLEAVINDGNMIAKSIVIDSNVVENNPDS
jgi:hypothetical protein